MTDDELRGRTPKIPEPAWYNKDNVYETDQDSAERNESGEGMDAKNDLESQEDLFGSLIYLWNKSVSF